MDPTTLIAAVLSAGAVATAKEGAKDAATSAYRSLKAAVWHACPSAPVAELEHAPISQSIQATVAEQLHGVDASELAELLQTAIAVLDVLRTEDAEALQVVGVDLSGVQMSSLDVSGVTARGPGATGVRARNVDVAGPVTITDVRAEGPDDRKNT